MIQYGVALYCTRRHVIFLNYPSTGSTSSQVAVQYKLEQNNSNNIYKRHTSDELALPFILFIVNKIC